MHHGAALDGVRVLDLTDGTGRLAGKLLAEAGADVVRLRRGAPGAPMREGAADRGGALDWWFDGGVRRRPLDLAVPNDRESFRALAARADIFIETEPPGRLAGWDLDFDALRQLNPRLVQVSLTPFGRRGPRADWQVSDLVTSALGGVLSVTGLPDQPLNGWGRQCFNVGGFFAAICALTGLHAARITGVGQLIDLSLHQAVISCTEQVLMYWFYRDPYFPGGIAQRQASLHWTGLYEVVPCRTGHVMLTTAPNPLPIFAWLLEDGMAGTLADNPPTTVAESLGRAPEIMEILHRWAATKDPTELFEEGQRRHIPFGKLLTVGEAAAGPQAVARGFFRRVEWNGSPVQLPGPLFRASGTPSRPALPPPAADITTEALLQAWPDRSNRPASTPTVASHKPLAGLRVLDFTWVLAGPQATRVLGDLGADVIKLQTEERSQGANSSEFPYFLMWNRNKRSARLNMKHPDAVALFRKLVEQSDVVIDNFAPGVLERWGVGYQQAARWNERIVYLTMSGCGLEGPWRNYVTYAPTIHALCGLTYLTNPEGHRNVGIGFSLCDHISGLAGAVAILTAIEARHRTGRGQMIDMSQLEVGMALVGPAFVEYLNTGREPGPVGNRDVFEDFVPNEVYRCADGEWLAVTARNDAEWRSLCDCIGDLSLAHDYRFRTVEVRRANRRAIDARLASWAERTTADGAMRALQARGIPAGKVQTARDLTEHDEQLAARRWLVETSHATLGHQTVDRFPAEFGAASLDPYAASPAFGEHTFDVYTEVVGMSVEEIAAAIGDGLLN